MTAFLPIDVAARDTRPTWIARPAVVAALALTIIAIVLRRGQYGNAIAGLDEQFYLLAGDRMWHGELPYIDLWDRKPFGLFLLFALIRLLPGDGVFAAQLVATAFAAGTAWMVAILAHRRAGWPAAIMGGVFFLAGEIELWGDTTQTPVFYLLPVAVAAWLTLRAAADPLGAAGGRAAGVGMLLVGVAMQIKTNAVLEGCFFAAWYLFSFYRAERRPLVLAATTARLAILGLAPTLAVMAWFAAIGAFPDWWQANVLSVIAKGRPDDAAVAKMLEETVVLIAPILLLSLFGLWAATRRFAVWNRAVVFRLGWITVAAIDFGAIGGYYPHYALPLLLAASTLIAEGFRVRVAGPLFFGLSMIWPAVHTQVFMPRVGVIERGIARQVLAAIPSDVATRCLFIYEGPVIYYHLTHACRVSRFAFTAHLSSRREQNALGVDPRAELDMTMARRPGTVITVEADARPDRAMDQERRLMMTLRRDYRVVATLPHRNFTGDEHLLVWRRRDDR